LEKQYYQYVPCSTRDCRNMLRLSVSEKDFGRTVDAICSTCGAKSQVVLMDQKKLEGLVERLASAMTKAVSESDEVSEAREALHEAGIAMKVSFIGEFASILQREPPKPAQPKVREDGKVEIGTFSSEDTNWAKELKIKLDE
jgi:hypothetical protein